MCERPGGYGANHRRVRRQEEIIWIREQGFTLRRLAHPVAAQPPQLRRARRAVAAPALRPARRRRSTVLADAATPSCADMLARRAARCSCTRTSWATASSGLDGRLPALVRASCRRPRRPLGRRATAVIARWARSGRELVAARQRPSRSSRRGRPTIASSCGACALVGYRRRAAARSRSRPSRSRSTSTSTLDLRRRAAATRSSDTVDYGALCAVGRAGGRPPSRTRCSSALAERIADGAAGADDRASTPSPSRCASCGRRCPAARARPASASRGRRGMTAGASSGSGSNLGDRVGYLRDAVDAPARRRRRVAGLRDRSGRRPGGPGRLPEPRGRARHRPRRLAQLLGVCHRLEAAAGRVRDERWGPRTLDVDVLWVDGETGRRARPRGAPPADVRAPLRAGPARRPRPRPRAADDWDAAAEGEVWLGRPAAERRRGGRRRDRACASSGPGGPARRWPSPWPGPAGEVLPLARARRRRRPRRRRRRPALIATPDAAIADVAAAVEPVDRTVVAHLSGSLGLDAAAPHAARGASLHPLVALPDAERGRRAAGRRRWFAAGRRRRSLPPRSSPSLGGRGRARSPTTTGPPTTPPPSSPRTTSSRCSGQVERVAAGVGVPLEAYLDLARGSARRRRRARARCRPDRPGPPRRLGHRRTATSTPSRTAGARRALRGAGRGGGPRLCRRDAPSYEHDRATTAGPRARRRRAPAAASTVGLRAHDGLPARGPRLADGRRARRATDVVVASIFVNPLQFGASEDLAPTPATSTGDTALAEARGRRPRCSRRRCEEMYPRAGRSPRSRWPRCREPLEGAPGPTHFAGVATVVAKLFAIAGPCRAYFGEKDFQQLAVVRRMAARPVVPGRGRRLPDRARARRPGHVEPQRLPHAGGAGGGAGRCTAPCRPAGSRSRPGSATRPRSGRSMADLIDAEPLAELDYAEVVDAATLAAWSTRSPASCACWPPPASARARLIDNVGATVAERHPARSSRPAPGGRVAQTSQLTWPTSTCSCSAPAWPGCRPRCGPPRSTGMRVGVLTKAELEQATTRWAQGGVAAVLGGDPDSTDLHLADTLAAGAGLCDVDAVRVLVDEGPIARPRAHRARRRCSTATPTASSQLAREGGHSLPRIVHAGGAATGAEIERALVDAVRADGGRRATSSSFALDLIVEGGRCRGVVAADPDGAAHEVRAAQRAGRHRRRRASCSPSPPTRPRPPATASPWRSAAGVAVADVEFDAVPPDRAPPPGDAPAAALRGAARPRRAAARHARRALRRRAAAPRQGQPRHHRAHARAGRRAPVARRHRPRAASTSGSHHRRRADHGRPRPGDATGCRSRPAAHYNCGGIVTDLDGASSLPGLWVGGRGRLQRRAGRQPPGLELAARRHGVRPRVVEAIDRGRRRAAAPPAPCARCSAAADIGGRSRVDAAATATTGRCRRREELQRTMTANAGVLRSAESLDAGGAGVRRRRRGRRPRGRGSCRNLATVGARAVRGGPRPRGEPRRPHPHRLRRDPRRPAPPLRHGG